MNACLSSPHRRRLVAAGFAGFAGVVGAVSGCASRTSSSSSSGAATSSASPGPGASNGARPTPGNGGEPPLRIEQRWLEDWFRGTPVVVRADGSTALSVEVPAQYCFDPGRSDVKAPLQAVVDRVAQTLRRRGSARLQIAAPADGPPSTHASLLQARVAKLRSLFHARGVAASRVSTATSAPADGVLLRLLWPEQGG